MANSRRPGCRLATAAVIFLVLGVGAVIALSWLGQRRSSSRRASSRTMYVCGHDLCRESGEYGQLVYPTGINVWQNPEPDRGGVHHQVANGDRVEVIAERRVFEGPGGLWYELEGGGWTNDLWLTETRCSASNIAEFSFTNCLAGTY